MDKPAREEIKRVKLPPIAEERRPLTTNSPNQTSESKASLFVRLRSLVIKTGDNGVTSLSVSKQEAKIVDESVSDQDYENIARSLGNDALPPLDFGDEDGHPNFSEATHSPGSMKP